MGTGHLTLAGKTSQSRDPRRRQVDDEGSSPTR